MTTTRELCRVLSATLQLWGVERWAEKLIAREFLPGFDRKVNALDAALLLGALKAELLDLTIMERNKHAKLVVQDIQVQRQAGAQ